MKLAVVLCAIFLIAHGVFGSDGLFTYLQKRREFSSLHEQIKQTERQNQELQKEVLGLKSNPAAIERYAREDLHMARRKEMIYVLPHPAQEMPASGNPAFAKQPKSLTAPAR
ncbi:MAG: FtsB family cell division protein [Terriglobia bacterium]